MLVTPSRRALAVLSCSLAATAIAGCGSGDDASSGSGASSAGGDGVELLNAAYITPDGAALKSGTVGLTVSGTFESPKDKGVSKVEGKVSLNVSADEIGSAKGSVPPTKVTFDLDGAYTSGSGKPTPAKYAGGFSYLDDQLYVNWKGKDYAFGKELTKQFATGFTQGIAGRSGDTKQLQEVTSDPKKLMDTLDLQPGTWLEDSKVSDGPEIDGVATDAVTGTIDIKATATDLRDGFKKLPAAFPNAPGLKELEQMGSLDDAEIKEAEESLSTRDLTAYVGKEDGILRRLKLDIAGKDKGSDAASADLVIQIDLTKVNQPQGITAPKTSAPVTDLFAELQKDFPGIGGLLGG